MYRAESLNFETHPKRIPSRNWRMASIALCLISVALVAAVLIGYPQERKISLAVLIAISVVLCSVVFLHLRFLLHVRQQHRKAIFDLDITEKEMVRAEKLLEENRARAESAASEANALRRTTVTLTQDLRLDDILDVLLKALADLIPYHSAMVLLSEDDSRLFVAREKTFSQTQADSSSYPLTLDVANFPLLQRMLKHPEPVLLADVTLEEQWRDFASCRVRSWFGVPLVAADQTLGILCVGHNRANTFTLEHLRIAGSLAISAVAGVQSARLHERAEIYSCALERRLSDLDEIRKALEHTQGERLISEERFQRVFQSSPIALSITTVDGGRFLEVNRAFEQRHGYSRTELLGRSVHELGFWEKAVDRAVMITQVRRGVAIRNLITQLRTKSGELKLTAYSADQINFDGKACVLAISGDIPEQPATLPN